MSGRLLDHLPDNTWAESRHRRPHPRTDDPSTRPVVVVHGAVGSRSNFTGVVAELRNPDLRSTVPVPGGRPVLSVSYGHHGTQSVTRTFAQVREKLNGIVADAGPVDLVAHSQGGLLALAATGVPELSGRIGRLVGLAGNFRGVTGYRRTVSVLAGLVPAWPGNLSVSRELRLLMDYAARSTVPITQILTTADRYIPADRAAALHHDDPASGTPAHRGPVRIITVDDVSHEKMPYSRRIGRLVAEALS